MTLIDVHEWHERVVLVCLAVKLVDREQNGYHEIVPRCDIQGLESKAG